MHRTTCDALPSAEHNPFHPGATARPVSGGHRLWQTSFETPGRQMPLLLLMGAKPWYGPPPTRTEAAPERSSGPETRQDPTASSSGYGVGSESH